MGLSLQKPYETRRMPKKIGTLFALRSSDLLKTRNAHKEVAMQVINYTQIAREFEKIPDDSNLSPAAQKQIDEVVQDFVNTSKQFETLDANVRNHPRFIVKVLAKGDSNLLERIPPNILDAGKTFLKQWANEHPAVSLSQRRPQTPEEWRAWDADIMRLIAYMAKFPANIKSQEGLSELWRLFDQQESIELTMMPPEHARKILAVALVQRDGELLRRLHEFDNHKEVVEEAVKQKPQAFRLASDELKKDIEFVVELAQKQQSGPSILAYVDMPTLVQLVQKHPYLFGNPVHHPIIQQHPELQAHFPKDA